MLKLIRNAQAFAPESRGVCDILIADQRILRIDQDISISGDDVEVIDANEQIVVPGFVDSLVHISGGGGEGGFTTRTPELEFHDAVRAGVTTLVGALGTDSTTRSLHELHGKARALSEQGLSCYHYTGSYQVPAPTISGSIRDDMVFIDAVIGVGEIAIADHRGSQPSAAELARIASDVTVGGLLTGKKGVISIHVGEQAEQLDLLHEVASGFPVSLDRFYPTHINRQQGLLQAGIAFAKQGGVIDFTTSTTEQLLQMGEIRASHALAISLKAGVPPDNVTMSSDAQGSLPHFDEHGKLQSLEIGRIDSLLNELKLAVHTEEIELPLALATITRNPADALGLSHKGRLQAGCDADLLFMDEDLTLNSVIAKGAWVFKDREHLTTSIFER